jgi:Domain of unknown function (DUF4203)
MLPVTYQLPAAVVLVAGGVLACFFGYRFFRVVLAVYGFILGALLASSVVVTNTTFTMIVAALVGGLIGALVLNLAYFLGVALLGAAIGAVVASSIWAAIGREPGALVVILFAVAGAIAATLVQRYVVIVGTAFGGAWTLLVGVLSLAGGTLDQAAAASGDVWVLYPLNPAPGHGWVPWAWLALGLAGTAVQLSSGGGRKRTTVRKRR